jgi:hypothetical protein
MAQNKDDIRQRGCAAVVGCPETMPMATACATTIDPAAEAQNFESQLMTQFGIDGNCKGATFAVYRSPDTKISDKLHRLIQEPHWTLIIDFQLGASKQSWSLQYQLGRILEGSSRTPAKMASDICAIVMGHGGTLVR